WTCLTGCPRLGHDSTLHLLSTAGVVSCSPIGSCAARLVRPRKSTGHTCPMSIVVMEKSAAMHIGHQLLRLSYRKERAKPHAASTLPEHARCRLYPALCL